MVTFSYNQW